MVGIYVISETMLLSLSLTESESQEHSGECEFKLNSLNVKKKGMID